MRIHRGRNAVQYEQQPQRNGQAMSAMNTGSNPRKELNTSTRSPGRPSGRRRQSTQAPNDILLGLALFRFMGQNRWRDGVAPERPRAGEMHTLVPMLWRAFGAGE